MKDKEETSSAIQKTDHSYQKVTDKFFYASLLNIPLFGVPAFVALFLGRYLDKRFDTGKTFLVALLAVAFVSSWVLVLRNNRKITREYRQERMSMKERAVDKE